MRWFSDGDDDDDDDDYGDDDNEDDDGDETNECKAYRGKTVTDLKKFLKNDKIFI